jgi:hypothetical protein
MSRIQRVGGDAPLASPDAPGLRLAQQGGSARRLWTDAIGGLESAAEIRLAAEVPAPRHFAHARPLGRRRREIEKGPVQAAAAI